MMLSATNSSGSCFSAYKVSEGLVYAVNSRRGNRRAVDKAQITGLVKVSNLAKVNI